MSCAVRLRDQATLLTSELGWHGSEPSRPLNLITEAIQLKACIFLFGHIANEIVSKC